MESRLIRDPRVFEELTRQFMDADPFTTNVIGVVLKGRLDREAPQHSDDVWIAVLDHERVVGIAMHTPPHRPFLARMPVQAASTVARHLFDAGHTLSGVNGEAVAVAAFADEWGARTGRDSSVQIAMRFYRLTTLKSPDHVSGLARTARPEDSELLRTWATGFKAEANPSEPLAQLLDETERRLGAGLISLWVDEGRPVSMAARTLAANGVARVSLVYTEPNFRRRGYGAAITASVSRLSIESGATHVTLYADRANPTSNGVYQSIGYVADHDSENRIFID